MDETSLQCEKIFKSSIFEGQYFILLFIINILEIDEFTVSIIISPYFIVTFYVHTFIKH